MTKLVFGALLLFGAFVLRFARAATSGAGGARAGTVLRALWLSRAVLGLVLVVFSMMVVIGPGEVGVQHAFGTVSPTPLLSGIRLVPPWSSEERYSTREEQFPPSGEQVEEIAALSPEQMGMTVDAGVIRRSRPRRLPNSGSKCRTTCATRAT